MKKPDCTFRITKIVFIIINSLIAILISIFFIGSLSVILSLAIISGLILLHKFQDKLIDKIGQTKLVLIYVLPAILITIIILSFSILIRAERVEEWNEIKDDYEIINNIAIKLYEDNENKSMSLYFGEDYSSLILFDFTRKDEEGNYEKITIDLNEEEKKSLKNIANFYPRQECITIRENDIDYADTDAVGACIVKYVRNNRNVDLKGFKHLTGNWYYFRAR